MHHSNLNFTLKYPYKHHAWAEIKHRLRQITNLKDDPNCSSKLSGCLNAIYALLHWNVDDDLENVFNGLATYLDDYALPEQRINFYVVVFPCIVNKCMDIEKLGNFKKLYKTDTTSSSISLSLTNSEQASILACRLLCLFPCKNESNSRSLNYERLYQDSSNGYADLIKLFSYFEMIATDPGGPSGSVTWLINTIDKEDDLLDWLTNELTLRPLSIHTDVHSICDNTENILLQIINSHRDLLTAVDKGNTEHLILDLFIDTYRSTTTIKDTRQEVCTICIDAFSVPFSDETILANLTSIHKGMNQKWGLLGVKAKCRKLPEPVHVAPPVVIDRVTHNARDRMTHHQPDAIPYYNKSKSTVKIRPSRSNTASNKRQLTTMEEKQLHKANSCTSKRSRSQSLNANDIPNNKATPTFFTKFDHKNVYRPNKVKLKLGYRTMKRSVSDCGDSLDDMQSLNNDQYTSLPTLQRPRDFYRRAHGYGAPTDQLQVYVSRMVDLALSDYLNTHLNPHPHPHRTSSLEVYCDVLTTRIMQASYKDIRDHHQHLTQAEESVCSATSSMTFAPMYTPRPSPSKLSRRFSLESDVLPTLANEQADLLQQQQLQQSTVSIPDSPTCYTAKSVEYKSRRRSSEPIRSVMGLLPSGCLASDGRPISRRLYYTSKHMIPHQASHLPDTDTASSEDVIIDWLSADNYQKNSSSSYKSDYIKIKIDEFADKLSNEIMADVRSNIETKISEERERSDTYNRKHFIINNSQAYDSPYKVQSDSMLLGCGFFPNPAPCPSLLTIASAMADRVLHDAILETVQRCKYESELNRNLRSVTYVLKDASSIDEQLRVLLLWASASKRNVVELCIAVANKNDRQQMTELVHRLQDLTVGALLKKVVDFLHRYEDDYAAKHRHKTRPLFVVSAPHQSTSSFTPYTSHCTLFQDILKT